MVTSIYIGKKKKLVLKEELAEEGSKPVGLHGLG